MKALSIEGDLQEKVVGTLGRTPMFRSLPPEELSNVAKGARLLGFEPDEPMLKRGEASDSFLLLVRGQAAFQIDREGEAVEVGRVGPPELLGIVGLVLGEPHPATVVACEHVMALEFGADTFQEMFQKIPGFGMSVMRGLAVWLKELSGRVPLPRYAGEGVPEAEVLGMLPVGFLERHRVLPLEVEGNVLTLGFVDDPSSQALSGARQLLPGLQIRPLRIEAELFNRALASHGGVEELRAEDSTTAAVEPRGSAKLDHLITRMASEGASDLHLTAGRKPRWRIDGRMLEIGDAGALGPEDVLDLFKPVMDEQRLAELEECLDVDFGYSVAGTGRVRVNLFRERHGFSAAMRLISGKILTFEQLGLPAELRQICDQPKGLILVTGPTGSGKSTTLAAMIDHINKTRAGHILTLEDPIEFVHTSQASLVTQRELGSHMIGFGRGLRAALREDPDVILVGEMRDPETIQLALEAANTGHLVLSTLHTASAVMTVDRIVDTFESGQQAQVRASLSEVLLGVLSQTLCRRIEGGRVAAVEVLMVGHAVANLIKEGKTKQIPNVMQTARKDGNRLLNQELARLVKEGVVEAQEALGAAADRKDLERMIGGGARAQASQE